MLVLSLYSHLFWKTTEIDIDINQAVILNMILNNIW